MHQPELARFSSATRAAHWLNAVGFFVLAFTGAVMWGAPGTQWVGYRNVVRDVHTIAGLVLFVPLIASYATSRSLRDDVRRLARWTSDDRRWWLPSQRRHAKLAKFNPGQKANAAYTFAALLALLVSGVMLKWYEFFSLSDNVSAGATFVHDWTSYVLGLVVIGHIVMALRDRESLRGMIQGRVSDEWARSQRPRWWAESQVVAADEPAGDRDEIDREPVDSSR